MQLDSRQTIIVGVLVLFLGKYLNRKIGFLRQFNIPEPVTGGIVASVIFGIVHALFNFDITFSKHYQNIFLVVFFTAIGLKTEFKSIVKGGRLLALLTVVAIVYIFAQNYLGAFLAQLFGINKNAGILAGSAALQGGHGNIVAWAPILEKDYGVNNAMEIGMTVATLGLIFGGILGGPVAKYLIKKYKLTPSDDPNVTVGVREGHELVIDYNSALKALLLIALSIGVGIHLKDLTDAINFTLPLFVTCMFGGVLLANLLPYVVPKLKCPHGSPTLAIVSDLSLGLFLAMAMMSLKFWEIGGEALFIFVSVIVQVIAVVLFSAIVVFRVLGKNYDAAVISAGYVGSSLGATPTAMANMAAVTQRYGASPMAFVVIPIVAAFIIQVSNALVIQTVLKLLN
jgi:ESS family glutamate:Na+ symporter